MKAIFNNQVIAEAPNEELIKIEGNWYFPPTRIKKDYFTPTDHHTTCFWKGEASYYTITVDDQSFENGAWYYPAPKEGSTERVGNDYTDYVAFYPQVPVTK